MKARVHQPAELTPAQIYILLGGWGAHPPDGSDAGIFELGGGWGVAECRGDEDDIQPGQDAPIMRTGRRYEQFLRIEAQRLAIKPPYRLADGRELFFGEFASLPAAERWAYEQAQPEADDENE